MPLARHIRSLNEWASARPRYVVRVGDGRLSFWSLTDEAISDLRDTIATDFWFERKINRRNREIRTAAQSEPFREAAE